MPFHYLKEIKVKKRLKIKWRDMIIYKINDKATE